MRIGFMSDCHLGERKFRRRENGRKNMWSEVNYRCFEEACDVLSASGSLDYVVVAGDLFDHANPDVEAVMRAKEGLKRLSDVTEIILMGGNHDSSSWMALDGYHPFYLLGDHVTKVIDEPLTVGGMTLIPYGCLNEQSYGSIPSGGEVLVCHGHLSDKSNYINDWTLPMEVAKGWKNLVFGHIHLASVHLGQAVNEITLGSLMPSPQAGPDSLRPAVYVYDDGQWSRFELKSSPQIMSRYCTDKRSLDDTMKEWGERLFSVPPILSLYYSQSMKDVDEYLYKKVIQNCLNFSLVTHEKPVSDTRTRKTEGFWEYVQKEWPEWYGAFKGMAKGD